MTTRNPNPAIDTIAGADNGVAAALAAGVVIGAAGPIVPDVKDGDRAIPAVLVPDGYSLESLQEFIELKTPTRRRAAVTLFDSGSFVKYVTDFKLDDSRVFADMNASQIVAIVDYHAPGPDGDAAWGQHRATLKLRLEPEWERWVGMHGKRVAQLAFAEFIEDNLPDIAEPDGTKILQISRSLSATKQTNFASDVRLDNGQTQLTFHETIQGSATVNATKVDIPNEFTLGLSPFENSRKYAVRARLRYRVGEGGKLAIGIDLVGHDRVLRDAFEETLADVEKAIGIQVLRGNAPAEFK